MKITISSDDWPTKIKRTNYTINCQNAPNCSFFTISGQLPCFMGNFRSSYFYYAQFDNFYATIRELNMSFIITFYKFLSNMNSVW